MNDVISLSELSDEPRERNMFGYDFSPRLKAVLERMPNNSTGTATRVKGALINAGIYTLVALQAADRYTLGRKHLGSVSLAAIDAALAAFGLYRVDVNPPIVVRDGAAPYEAHCQRLQRWVEERIAECVAKQDEYGQAGSAHETTEQEVLIDVMLILDGRMPLNKRRWFGCRDLDCEREYNHEGPHRRRREIDGVEETEVWP